MKLKFKETTIVDGVFEHKWALFPHVYHQYTIMCSNTVALVVFVGHIMCKYCGRVELPVELPHAVH